MLSLWSASIALFLTITLTGLVPFFWHKKKKYMDVLTSFGGGVLLSAAFIHMLPSAMNSLGERAGLFTLLGYLLLFLIEKFTMAHACGEHACPNHKIGFSAFLGLSVHSIVTGFALGATLKQGLSWQVSGAMLSAILIHKVPETIALTALLFGSHWKRKQVFWSVLGYACMSPLGIWLSSESFALLPFAPMYVLGMAVSLSTGTFLYIASSDLLPHLHRKDIHPWLNLLAFAAGIILLSFGE